MGELRVCPVRPGCSRAAFVGPRSLGARTPGGGRRARPWLYTVLTILYFPQPQPCTCARESPPSSHFTDEDTEVGGAESKDSASRAYLLNHHRTYHHTTPHQVTPFCA